MGKGVELPRAPRTTTVRRDAVHPQPTYGTIRGVPPTIWASNKGFSVNP
jgi:hypothetical protein